MRGSQLFPFPVLAAWQFDAGPDPVFLPVLDRISCARLRKPLTMSSPCADRLRLSNNGRSSGRVGYHIDD